MSRNVQNRLTKLVGSQSTNSGLLQACNALESMPGTDLTKLLVILFDERVQKVSTKHIIEGNRFHQPSTVSPRIFNIVERLIYDNVPSDVELVELSPLQPFGADYVLADISATNVIPALRGSQVTADVASSLFRLAYAKFGENTDNVRPIHFAASSRSTRAQQYPANSGFLPHFKCFAQTTIGNSSSSAANEIQVFSQHLANTVGILDKISALPESPITNMKIYVGHTGITKSLIEKGVVDTCELRKNTGTPGYDIVSKFGLNMPRELSFDNPDLEKQLEDLGLGNIISSIRDFKSIIEKEYPDLLSRLWLDLARIRDFKYYKHMTLRVMLTNCTGTVLQVADGGTTNWAARCASNRRLYTVVSALGTELLCKHFINTNLENSH